MTVPSDTLAATNPTRELAAIMFSDIAGYTAIMGRDERKAIGALEAHRALLRSILPRFNGRMLGEIGDGTLTSFHSAVDAVHCAREVQQALADDPQLRLRIGIHVGDVLFRDNTSLGDGVNVASRIHALAPPGGICISERVFEDIRNKPEIRARDLGNKTLKNVDQSIRVYALESDSAAGSAFSSIARMRRTRIASIAALVVIAAAIAIIVARSDTIRSIATSELSLRAAPAEPATLAVLPFANLSANKDDEYFSDGITDEIRGDLSKIARLQVTARTSSYAFKGQNEDVKKIAGLLHVRNVLDGSVQRTPDRVRIEVELIDASNGFTVWTDRYDKKLADVFQIQSEVTESVAEKLKVKLFGDEKARLDNKPTQNLEAYNEYLLGDFHLQQWTPDGFTKAVESYNAAIEKDPRFAQAYAHLAYAYELAGDETMPQRESTAKAKAAAAQALELDDQLGAAHSAMGMALMNDWDFSGAERQFKRALTLDPSDGGIHEAYAEYLMSMGRYSEALTNRQRVRNSNPIWPGATVAIGDVYFWSRQYERALQYYQEAIQMAPDFYEGYLGRGWVLFVQGKHEEAVPDFQKAAALADSPVVQAELGEIYALTGRRTEALKILEQLQHRSTTQYVSAIAFFAVYAGLGDKDRAFQWLEKAYEERSGYMESLRAPQFDGVRSDPRFQAIYKKVGMPP